VKLRRTADSRACFRVLPKDVQRATVEAYERWVKEPDYPKLAIQLEFRAPTRTIVLGRTLQKGETAAQTGGMTPDQLEKIQQFRTQLCTCFTKRPAASFNLIDA